MLASRICTGRRGDRDHFPYTPSQRESTKARVGFIKRARLASSTWNPPRKSGRAIGRYILGYMEKGIQNSHGARPVNQDI